MGGEVQSGQVCSANLRCDTTKRIECVLPPRAPTVNPQVSLTGLYFWVNLPSSHILDRFSSRTSLHMKTHRGRT